MRIWVVVRKVLHWSAFAAIMACAAWLFSDIHLGLRVGFMVASTLVFLYDGFRGVIRADLAESTLVLETPFRTYAVSVADVQRVREWWNGSALVCVRGTRLGFVVSLWYRSNWHAVTALEGMLTGSGKLY